MAIPIHPLEKRRLPKNSSMDRCNRRKDFMAKNIWIKLPYNFTSSHKAAVEAIDAQDVNRICDLDFARIFAVKSGETGHTSNVEMDLLSLQ